MTSFENIIFLLSCKLQYRTYIGFDYMKSTKKQQFPGEQKSNKMGRIAYGGRIERWQI